MARIPKVDDVEFMRAVHAATRRGGARSAHLLLFIVLTFLVLFMLWARQASLEEVTRGTGKVIPSSQVQVIQNLEGGIIAGIFVREGQIVESGEVLIRIDNTEVASDYRETRARYLGLLAAVARLTAMANGRDVVFPQAVLDEAPGVAADELAQYNSALAQLESDIGILRRQVEQRNQELRELRGRVGKLKRSLELVDQEIDMTEPLVRAGVISQVELLRLQREANDVEADIQATELAIPRAQAALSEASERIEERKISARTEAWYELNRFKSDLAVVTEAITGGQDRVFRSEVRSPVHGTVKQVLVTTIGGVIQPGEDLVEIVPIEDSLLIEAQIRPADIAFLRPGQDATVKITAYDFSIYGGLKGKVENISADTIKDERDESFYRVRLRTDVSYLGTEENPLPIIPGMTASVDILTGEKTVLDYLLNPILRAQSLALRER
ncbi:MAG: HlyD family type I secretion periplasmic adaptor subunit [Alphaproteobacteria bacterium]